MNFSGFIGNESLKKTLGTAIENNRLPHAMVLSGQYGLGKHSLARLIAKAVVCTSENKPCGTCPACKKAQAGAHPDIIVEEGTGVTGAISVATIKEIVRDAYKSPQEADFNIYLLFVKERLSEASQNKLLKVLEEPPGNTIFILTVKSPDTLLTTVRSRVQIFMLNPVDEDEGAKYLCENYDIDIDSAKKLVNIFSGNLGMCVSKILGNSDLIAHEKASEFSKILCTGLEHNLLAETASLIKNREMFYAMTQNLVLIFRDACTAKAGFDKFIGSDSVSAKMLSAKLTTATLIKLQEICKQYADYSQRNLNMSLLVTSFCATMKKAVLS